MVGWENIICTIDISGLTRSRKLSPRATHITSASVVCHFVYQSQSFCCRDEGSPKALSGNIQKPRLKGSANKYKEQTDENKEHVAKESSEELAKYLDIECDEDYNAHDDHEVGKDDAEINNDSNVGEDEVTAFHITDTDSAVNDEDDISEISLNDNARVIREDKLSDCDSDNVGVSWNTFNRESYHVQG